MHLEEYVTSQITEVLEGAKKVGIVPTKVAEVDAFCAASGLINMLCDKYPQKEFHLVYPGKVPEGCQHFTKKELIQSNIFERSLVVSINYNAERDARVNYTTDDNKLTLYMSPVSKDFDLRNVKSELHGFNYDVIITVGVNELDDLGQTYRELKEDFDKATIINIDNTERNIKYGYINAIDNTSHSLSNLIFNLGYMLGLSPNHNAASALLQGITFNRAKF